MSKATPKMRKRWKRREDRRIADAVRVALRQCREEKDPRGQPCVWVNTSFQQQRHDDLWAVQLLFDRRLMVMGYNGTRDMVSHAVNEKVMQALEKIGVGVCRFSGLAQEYRP